MAVKTRAKRNRDIYVLREYEGMSYADIGEKFRLSPNYCSQIVAAVNEPFYRPGFYRDPMPWKTRIEQAGGVYEKPSPTAEPAPLPPEPPRPRPPQRTFYGVWDDESNNLMGDRMNLNEAARAARQFRDARMFWYTDDVDEA